MDEWSIHELGYPVVELSDSILSTYELVIRYLVGQLVVQGRLPQSQTEEVVSHVLTREQQGTTVLPNGRVAVPHSKANVPEVLGIVGRSAASIRWDGAPESAVVNHVCLLLLAVNRPKASFRTLEHVTKTWSKI